MALTPAESEQLAQWQAGIERRMTCQTGRGRPTRGATRFPQEQASDAWECEGRVQCPGQMSIWDALAEAENEINDAQ